MKKLIASGFLFLAFCLPVSGQQKQKTQPKPPPQTPSPNVSNNSALRSAPFFNVTSLEGKNFNSADLKGKIIVLNLWFINCPFCVEEIKLLNQIVDEYQGNNRVVFLGLATNNNVQLQEFLKKNPFKYKVVPRAMMQILSFGTPNKSGQINMPFPIHIVIDRDGKIVVDTNGMKGVNAVREELKRQFAAKDLKAK